jgi:hypothetical protein
MDCQQNIFRENRCADSPAEKNEQQKTAVIDTVLAMNPWRGFSCMPVRVGTTRERQFCIPEEN